MIESGDLINDVPLIVGNNIDEGLVNAFKFSKDESLLKELHDRWNDELGPLYIASRFHI